MTLKRIFAALLFSMSLGFSSGVLAQDVAPLTLIPLMLNCWPNCLVLGQAEPMRSLKSAKRMVLSESADDLARVSGIGPTTVDRMRDQVAFEE